MEEAESADELALFRLGVWEALIIVKEEGTGICPLCGRDETS